MYQTYYCCTPDRVIENAQYSTVIYNPFSFNLACSGLALILLRKRRSGVSIKRTRPRGNIASGETNRSSSIGFSRNSSSSASSSRSSRRSFFEVERAAQREAGENEIRGKVELRLKLFCSLQDENFKTRSGFAEIGPTRFDLVKARLN